jgi:hypothetical protein
VIAQPLLYVPPEIELRILAGELSRRGSVVREVANGRIFKHLKEIAPEPQQVEKAMNGVKLNAKTILPVVSIAAIMAGTAAYATKRRKKVVALVDPTPVPECIANFENSLRAYVDAGREGTLNAEIVTQLVTDLDSIKAFSEDGNAVEFSLDQLMPLFEVVANHTSVLADAYSAELDGSESQERSSDDDTVVYLRRHLEAQKRNLAEAS